MKSVRFQKLEGVDSQKSESEFNTTDSTKSSDNIDDIMELRDVSLLPLDQPSPFDIDEQIHEIIIIENSRKQLIYWIAGFFLLIFSTVILVVILKPWEKKRRPPDPTGRVRSDFQLSFLGIGDWGGSDEYPFWTEAQWTCGQTGMARVAKEIGANFTLALGDNFYTYGLTSDSVAQRMLNTFDHVYSDPALDHTWHAVAGNHDHCGDTSVQIDFTAQSDRWHFPDYFYSFDKTFKTNDSKEIKASFIMVDTQLLDHESHLKYNTTYADTTSNLIALDFMGDNSSCHIQFWHEISRKYAHFDSFVWIENELQRANDSDFIFLGGHYPVFSVCDHGPTPSLLRMRPLFEEYSVTAFLSGHDHCQSVVQEDPTKPVYVVTGNGMECCYPPISPLMKTFPEDWIKFQLHEYNSGDQKSGFGSYILNETHARIRMHDDQGNILHQLVKPSRKHSSVES